MSNPKKNQVVNEVADAYTKLRVLRPDLTDPLDDCFRRMMRELTGILDEFTRETTGRGILVEHDDLPPGPDNFITRTPYPVRPSGSDA